MIDKVKSAGVAFTNCIERVLNAVMTPPVATADWIARKWLSLEIKEKDSFIEFLEKSMAEQRVTLVKYINENKSLSERLSKYEKFGEENLIKQTAWLSQEVSRINTALNEKSENNEKLNISNARMRAAGDGLAELIATNKPKRHLTKKDKQIQRAVEEWNKNSR